jgi:UBX domain-containing protein 1
VLDPREFMKRARDEMGAQSIDAHRAAGGGQAGPSTFTGAGHTLSGEQVQGAPAPKPPTEHSITFYKDGFTVDDGPLRKGDDPANAAFLAAVNQGQMPAELIGEDGAAEGDVHIIDKSGEVHLRQCVRGEGEWRHGNDSMMKVGVLVCVCVCVCVCV